ncbi:MAG: hypothetical protein JSS82_02760 [Bacteroidetes bacterium]|nr:hypothetical protein [Bacteroidota bacterium]
MKNLRFALGMLLIGAVTLTSCLKKNYDGPPDTSGYDPHLATNMTLLQASKMGTTLGGNVKITNDSTVWGIVVADDRSGNLYKQIVIQDSTGGIALMIDAYDLYGDYPVGRKVYVKLKGLYIGNYGGLPQIGYAVDNTGSLVQIPASLADKYIVKGNINNPVVPKKITMAQASGYDATLLNTLVSIDSVEFVAASAGISPFAQPSSISSGTDVYIEDCSGTQLDIRTSGYANFASYLVPSGKGTITGIYTVYKTTSKTTPQLVIRDTSDAKLYGPRCSGSQAPQFVSIDSIRHLYAGSDVMLGSYKIKGVVVSDNASGNFGTNNKTLYIQDGNRGISVFFNQAHSFSLGDSLNIVIAGGTLTSYNGVLEIKSVAVSSAIKVGTGTIVPRQVTISEINTHYSDYEGTIVKIVNATISGGTTYGDNAGNKTLTDASGTITLYTASAASFAGSTIPSGSHTVTGLINEYNTTHQIQLRSLNDVQ